MQSLTIVSFDRTKDAAATEAAEDRSLNLLLRRKRVRSEIFRLTLSPDAAQVEYLFDILEAGPRRPIIFLLREIESFAAQLTAVERLRDAGTDAQVCYFGDDAAGAIPPPNIEFQIFAEEDAAVMLALAEALAAK